MSNNIQYRLHHYETAPPADSWNQISDRLDEEFDTGDISLSQKFSGFEQVPPAASFLNIMAALDPATVRVDSTPSTAERETAKVIPMRLRRVAAAAVICVAISALYLYFNTGSRQADVAALINTTTKTGVVTPAVTSPASVIPAPSPKGTLPATIASIAAVPLRPSVRKRSSSEDYDPSASIRSSYEPDSDLANLNYAPINTTERNNAEQDIVIPTEPIRDQQGNIIMDENLVSAPDVNYVTVTGPNGEQTKISKKFLHALGYMNARSSGDEFTGITLHEGSLWKWLFQEWRQKLLTQPSFIPSATNFLDIMELKEILHENF